jgi:hypothetical protein
MHAPPHGTILNNTTYFNILFVILSHDKLELEDTNVNNILEKCTLFSYIVPYNKHPDDG